MKGSINIALIVGLAFSFVTKQGMAQDPTLSQFNLNKYFYNPAYTGDHRGYQVAATYRTLWPSIPGKAFPGPLSTYYGYFDGYLQRGRSYTAGAGIFAMQDIEGEGVLKTSTLGISYAQHFAKIGGTSEKAPRIEMSIGFKYYVNFISINWDKLIFIDDLDIDRGITGESEYPQQGIGKKVTTDLDLGLTLKNNFKGKNKWYNEIGFSMAHVLSPSLSMTGSNTDASRLPKKYIGSYRTSIGIKKNRVYLGTTLLFEKQNKFQVLNSGIDIYFHPKGDNSIIPLWFSVMNRSPLKTDGENTNALIGSLKYKWHSGKKKKVVYFIGISVDIPYSGLALKTKGAYELSVGATIPKKKQWRVSACPMF